MIPVISPVVRTDGTNANSFTRRVLRSLEVVLGSLLLLAAAAKLWHWQELQWTLVDVDARLRSVVACAAIAVEAVVGLLLLIARGAPTRTFCLVVFVGLLCGIRVTLATTVPCRCMGVDAPPWIASVVLAVAGVTAVVQWVLVTRGGIARLCLLAGACALCGLLVGWGVTTPIGWTLVGPRLLAGHPTSLQLHAPTGQAEPWTIRGALSSCPCVEVVGVEGARVTVQLREPVIPVGVQPHLVVDIHYPASGRREELVMAVY